MYRIATEHQYCERRANSRESSKPIEGRRTLSTSSGFVGFKFVGLGFVDLRFIEMEFVG